MIPYEDLVAALTTWRARQGLPVAQSSAIGAKRAPAPTPTAPRALPNAMRGGGPTSLDDFDEGAVEDSALVEDSAYDVSGDDYVVPLGGVETETTAIGGTPSDPFSSKRGKRNDW